MCWVAFLFSFLTACLSGWQWYRLSWKESIIRNMQKEYAKTPSYNDKDLKEFRQVSFKGEWIHTPLFLQYKIHKGEIGCEVVLPFKHEGGQVFLVNKGWQKNCVSVEKESSMQVKGVMRSFLDFSQGTPPNIPPSEWYYMNGHEMKNSFGISFHEVLYVDASKGLPELPNNHLMYALTWAVLSVVFFSMMLKIWCRKMG